MSLASYCNNLHPHFLSVWSENDQITWSSDCPGTEDCRVWYECEACPHDPTLDDEMKGVYISHGYAHCLIDGFWAIDDGNHFCALTEDEDAANTTLSLAKRLKGGIWPVTVRNSLGHWSVSHAPGDYNR